MNKISMVILSAFVLNTTTSTITYSQAIRSSANNRARYTTTEYRDYTEPSISGSATPPTTNTSIVCGENAELNSSNDGCQCLSGYIPDTVNLGSCIKDPVNEEELEYVKKIYELKNNYNLKVIETENACSEILPEMNDMMGLSGWTTGLSTVGTLAGGTALTTSIMKTNSDREAQLAKVKKDQAEEDINNFYEILNAKTDLDDNITTSKTQNDENANTLKDFDNLINYEFEEDEKEVAKKIEDKKTEISDLNTEYGIEERYQSIVLSAGEDENVQVGGINLDADQVKTYQEEYSKLQNGYENDEGEKIYGLIDFEDEQKRIAENKVKVEDYKKSVENTKESLNSTDTKSQSSVDLIKSQIELKGQDYVINEAKEEKALKKSENLGTITSIAMGTATATSIGSTITSAINISKAGSVLEKIKSCQTKLNELNNIKMELEANVKEDDTSADTIIAKANAINSACSNFDNKNIESIKNLAIGATVSSAIGTATGATGTTTSIISNSKNKTYEQKNKLNTWTNIMAGVTTGTSIVSTALGATQVSKLKEDLENAKNCSEAF